MSLPKGPRPWSIHVFSGALLIAALANLIEALSARRALLVARWFELLPFIDWTSDLAIVASFTQFTIALIPLVWIYVFASSRARWLVLFFGIVKLVVAVHGAGEPAHNKSQHLIWFEAVLIFAALVMLFLPASSHWIRHKGPRDFATSN